MISRALALCAATAASSAVVPAASIAACEVRSGPNTAALVELYTSEGCSSCPPADRQLSGLRQALDPAADAVPLALHVGYWDYIGWKDPYARGAFGDRQNWLVHANKKRTVYTPQFFVGGTELGSTRGTLRDEVRRLNGTTAAAAIRLRAGLAPSGALAVDAEARTRIGTETTAMYVAVTESGLASKVTRGENGGATLQHDHVVREWIGPIRMTGGAGSVVREVALPPAWNRARLEVAAFVQDERTGTVLQAVRARQCTGS